MKISNYQLVGVIYIWRAINDNQGPIAYSFTENYFIKNFGYDSGVYSIYNLQKNSEIRIFMENNYYSGCVGYSSGLLYLKVAN